MRLKWSNEVPKAEGHYWFRGKVDGLYDWQPCILHVYDFRANPDGNRITADVDTEKSRMLEDFSGDWAGPIPLPEEPY